MRPIETSNVGAARPGYPTVALTINYYPDDVGTLDDYFCDDDIAIAYLKRSRYTLGTVGVSEEEMDGIAERIKAGDLIGLPVYAYVHSGVALSTGSFGCPWDSGQSGFVYMNANLASQYGDPEAALRSMVSEVGKVLNGEVYGYEIVDEDGEHVDSCWGFIGFEVCQQEAEASAKYWLNRLSSDRLAEAEEREAWAARGTVTA